jgi:hypothetical protein
LLVQRHGSTAELVTPEESHGGRWDISGGDNVRGARKGELWTLEGIAVRR